MLSNSSFWYFLLFIFLIYLWKLYRPPLDTSCLSFSCRHSVLSDLQETYSMSCTQHFCKYCVMFSTGRRCCQHMTVYFIYYQAIYQHTKYFFQGPSFKKCHCRFVLIRRVACRHIRWVLADRDQVAHNCGDRVSLPFKYRCVDPLFSVLL